MPRTKLGTAHREKTRGYRTAKELEAVLDGYFADCDLVGELYSEAGIALALNVPVETLADWWEGKGPDGYTWPVKRAYLRRLQLIVTHGALRVMGGMASRGFFALKQKRLGGWVDRVEAKSDINVNVKMGGGMDESDFQ